MEILILLIALFATLGLMKLVTFGILFLEVICLFGWVFVIWKFYPLLYSGSEKWRTAPVIFFINRLIVIAVAIYGFAIVMWAKT